MKEETNKKDYCVKNLITEGKSQALKLINRTKMQYGKQCGFF